MATLLRSVRYLRLSWLNSSTANVLKTAYRLSKCLENATATTTLRNNLHLSYRYLATENVEKRVEQQQQQQKLDRALYRLDVEVRKTGRISIADVKDIFDEIKTAGVASPTQSLLVIRCCGSLLPEELVKDRLALVDDIWKTLRNLQINLDVSHYNALLKVYLENEHSFSSTDFLADMEAKGVVPNRVTYQRLIGHYCQQGDMAGASKILDFMKQKELPINENVFNSLIQGHTRANDFESAQAILDVMRNAKLDPSADSYTLLMQGYAEKGDIDGIRSTIKQAEGGDVHLLDRDYMDVLVALSASGHSQYADEILAKLRKSVGYNQDAINAIYQLVNAGHEDVALKLLLTMPRQIQFSGDPIPSGRFFIRQMVKVGRPVESILRMCDDLKNLSANTVGIVLATESALIYDRTDYAVEFLKVMNDQGYPIRPHFFWPILVSCRKQGNEAGVYDTLRLMMSLGSPADSDTLFDYAFPAISLNDPDVILDKLKGLGFAVTSIVGPLVGQLIIQQKLEAAVQLVRTHPVRLTMPAASIRPLAVAYHETKNLECTLELLARINESRDSGQRTDWTGIFLLAYVRAAGDAIEDIVEVLNGLKNRRLAISNANADLILERVGSEHVDRLTQLLEELSSSSLEFGGGDEFGEGAWRIPHPREMNLEQLENHYVQLKAKNMSVRGILRRLIFQYCRVKNLKKAMEVKEEFDEANMLYTPAMLAQLMDIHVSHSNLDEALQYHSKLNECDADFLIDDHKIINLAALLVENDRVEEALKLIEEHRSSRGDGGGLRGEKSDLLVGNVWRLLKAAADKGNVDAVNRLFDVVMKCGYASPTNSLLGPTVKAHLVSNDVEGALKQFDHCCKTHRCTPLKNELLMKFIEMEDAEKLQRVVDLSTDVHGEMNTMYDLAFAFVDCNRVRQARKIFETPGIRARQQRLDTVCQRYLSEDKLESIESIVSVTRDLFLVDRDQLYFHLLRAHVKRDDVDKALGVWTALQEENVQPSERTLTFLADFLKSHDRPVPFAVPQQWASNRRQGEEEEEAMPKRRMERKTKFDDANDRFMEAVKNENADEAILLKKEMEERGRQITVSGASRLVELLANKNRVNDAMNITLECLNGNPPSFPWAVRDLLRHLAAAGNVASIDCLGERLTDEQKNSVRLNNHRASALIASGRHLELLESMEKAASDRENIPNGFGILGLLESHPELTERVERLANACAEQNFHNPLNMIWIHHFINGNYEKADDIFQATPVFKEHLLFMQILKKATAKKDSTMLSRLADTISRTQLSSKLKANVYSNLVNVCVDTNILDKAIASVEDVVTAGLSLSDLHPPSLKRLKSALEAQGKPVPFTVPTEH